MSLEIWENKFYYEQIAFSYKEIKKDGWGKIECLPNWDFFLFQNFKLLKAKTFLCEFA